MPPPRCVRAAVLALVATGASCKSREPPPPTEAVSPAPIPAPATPFAVQRIELGKRIGADKMVTAPTTTFGQRDTFYLSVVTDGAAPSKVIAARWTVQGGQLVQEQSESIAPTGPAATEFHVSRAGPWPAGNYRVEVFVDGASAGTKDFEVR